MKDLETISYYFSLVRTYFNDVLQTMQYYYYRFQVGNIGFLMDNVFSLLNRSTPWDFQSLSKSWMMSSSGERMARLTSFIRICTGGITRFPKPWIQDIHKTCRDGTESPEILTQSSPHLSTVILYRHH